MKLIDRDRLDLIIFGGLGKGREGALFGVG